jgi:ribosomal protein L14E/L6E/L27E
MKGDGLLSEKEKEDLMAQLDDPFAYLTGHIPEVVTLRQKNLKLRAFIKHQKEKKSFKERDVISIAWVLKRLDTLIKNEKNRVEEEDLTREQADDLAERIKGLLRAHVLLAEMLEGEDLDPIDVDKEETVEDVKRWMDYAKKIG